MRTLGLIAVLATGGVAPLGAASCASSEAVRARSGSGGANWLGAGSGGSDVGGACGLYQLAAVQKPVNLYILFDKSSSMAGSKWENAKVGLSLFVTDPASQGIRVALRFFPRPADATPACDAKAYQQPQVPFAPLPDNAAAIQQAIAGEVPDGFGTPMYPALGGALLEGIAQAKASPGSVSAVLLVSDGVPDGPAEKCAGVNPSDPAEVAKLALSAASYQPRVVTYVVGLPGVDQTTANVIAKAGGTDAAILVTGSDVAGAFEQALGKVRGDVLPCRYDIPEKVIKGEVALTLVNIELTLAGKKKVLAHSPSCSGDGWKYDDANKATAIELCPSTCKQLKSDKKAAIQVILGCDTLLL